MNGLIRKLRKALSKGDEAQSYAYGGGGLLLAVVVVALVVFMVR